MDGTGRETENRGRWEIPPAGLLTQSRGPMTSRGRLSPSCAPRPGQIEQTSRGEGVLMASLVPSAPWWSVSTTRRAASMPPSTQPGSRSDRLGRHNAAAYRRKKPQQAPAGLCFLFYGQMSTKEHQDEQTRPDPRLGQPGEEAPSPGQLVAIRCVLGNHHVAAVPPGVWRHWRDGRGGVLILWMLQNGLSRFRVGSRCESRRVYCMYYVGAALWAGDHLMMAEAA